LEKQIVGLTRLLLVALRVLTLLEIVVRAKLAESGEKLSKIYGTCLAGGEQDG